MNLNYYTEKYIGESQRLNLLSFAGGRVISWQSPSNIALIKYWGKHGVQFPDNANISFTLSKSYTQTELTYMPLDKSNNQLEYYFEGKRNEEFEKKILMYINYLQAFLPFLNDLKIRIKSKNTFPHSAGIASSASSISALALCLASMENELFGTLHNSEDFFRKASFLARLGSGSACRSVYGVSSLWGFTPHVSGSSNEIAIPMDSWLHPVYKTFNNAILVVDSSRKEISSTAGHNLMNSHFYKEGRKLQAAKNIEGLISALKTGDLQLFISIVENEALSLQALILSSNPGYILMKPNTIDIIQRIRQFREETGLPVTFTIDAGPNVPVLYLQQNKEVITGFIENSLKPLCEGGLWINDEVSSGPVKLN